MVKKSLIKKFRKHIGSVPWDVLEDFILNTPHVWRPINGHCFETYFKKMVRKMKHKTTSVGGDDVTDMRLNKRGLQLKTPYQNGTIPNKRVAFAMHKTHGREKRPYNLYKPKDFADFLVGKHPEYGVIICPKEKIPLNKDYPQRGWPEYLADPVHFDWDNEWVNRFDLLGVKVKKIPKIKLTKKNKFFPKIGKLTDLTDEEIIQTILLPENFRVLEQNLKGSIRQWYFEKIAAREKIKLKEPGKKQTTRTKIKVDYILKNGKKIQVKGRTKSLCRDSTIGVEVKGSHGRIPQRLYRKGDFDFLVVVLDPGLIPKKFQSKKVNVDDYNVVVIPTSDIPIHPRSKEWGKPYLKDIFKFNISDYPINDLSLLKKSRLTCCFFAVFKAGKVACKAK